MKINVQITYFIETAFIFKVRYEKQSDLVIFDDMQQNWIVIFFQCFLFNIRLMKNPYLNTDDYMIVREFNRLTTKNRSYSNSSQSSAWSKSSSKFGNEYGINYKSNQNNNRYHNQYAIPPARTPVYQVQRKRAQVFGVQELRYVPAYFESLNKFKEKQTSTEYIQKIEKSNKTIGLKSQKSLKQWRFYGSGYQQQRKQTQKQIQIPSPLFRERRISDHVKLKKRGSIVQQMIELNCNNAKSNQFYASVADLKSRGDLKSSQNLQFPVRLQRGKKKSLLFYEDSERQDKNIIPMRSQRHCQHRVQEQSYFSKQSEQQAKTDIKPVQSQIQDPIIELAQSRHQKMSMRNSTRSIKSKKTFRSSRQFPQSTQTSQKMKIEPDVIKVRDKIYFRYQPS